MTTYHIKQHSIQPIKLDPLPFFKSAPYCTNSCCYQNRPKTVFDNVLFICLGYPAAPVGSLDLLLPTEQSLILFSSKLIATEPSNCQPQPPQPYTYHPKSTTVQTNDQASVTIWLNDSESEANLTHPRQSSDKSNAHPPSSSSPAPLICMEASPDFSQTLYPKSTAAKITLNRMF